MTLDRIPLFGAVLELSMTLSQILLFGVIMAYLVMILTAGYFFRNAFRYRQYTHLPEFDEESIELKESLYTPRERTNFLRVLVLSGSFGFFLLILRQFIIM